MYHIKKSISYLKLHYHGIKTSGKIMVHLFNCGMSASLLVCVQNVEFVRTGYGKNIVKVLFIRRQGTYHDIIELKADVELTLNSRKDYLTGDNSDIIPTDTIKNTVHALAKIKGVGCQPLLTDIRSMLICVMLIILQRVVINHDAHTYHHPQY